MTAVRWLRVSVERLRRDEGGFAVATAILVLMIISLLSVAVLQTINVESHQSGHEVADEASFNLAESVLDAESLQIQEAWPGSSGALVYPATCNQSTTGVAHCPGANLTSSLSSTYAGVSYGSPTWSVKVIDDTSGPSYYSDTLAANPTSYDLNNDNRLWLRATATVWGQTEIVVTQVVRQTEVVTIPQATITSGGVSTENNGNKIIIEAKDPNSGLTGPVDLRCNMSGSSPDNSDPCAGWVSKKGQLDPSGAYTTGYVDPGGGYSTLSPATLAELKNTAQSQGTYYNGTCPTSLSGLIYVENASCSYNGGTFNSDASPGAIVFGNGTLSFNGNITYTGVIYMANGQGTAPTSATGGVCTAAIQNSVLIVHGGGTVYGSIFVDKCGTVDAGERQFDVNYDSNASSGLKAFATPSLAKNTFRIMPQSTRSGGT
jgi:Tfp pilus assembly protein PilX